MKRGYASAGAGFQGCYSICLPLHSLTNREKSSWLRLHGGIGLTMGFVRRDYWVPRLRQLVKNVRRTCYGCKTFHIAAFDNSLSENLFCFCFLLFFLFFFFEQELNILFKVQNVSFQNSKICFNHVETSKFWWRKS